MASDPTALAHSPEASVDQSTVLRQCLSATRMSREPRARKGAGDAYPIRCGSGPTAYQSYGIRLNPVPVPSDSRRFVSSGYTVEVRLGTIGGAIGAGVVFLTTSPPAIHLPPRCTPGSPTVTVPSKPRASWALVSID